MRDFHLTGASTGAKSLKSNYNLNVNKLGEVRRRFAHIAALLCSALLAGTLGYHFIEGWPLFDSLYMTVITLATVGYGETHPLGIAGRAFTIFLIIGGIGTVTYAFSAVTALIVEGDLSAALRGRRMEKKIARLSGHYIVCGAGHGGEVISAELYRTKRPSVLIERQPEVIGRVRDRLGADDLLYIVGDATDDKILKSAGVERASGVFAVLATDQDNAFVALSAKGLNPNVRVVCRQQGVGIKDKLIRSGADTVINPDYIGGLRMASEMIRPATTGFLDSMMRETTTVERFDEIAVPRDCPFVGRPVGEFKGSQGHAPLLLAVHDGDTGKYDINPDPDRPIKAGDRLVMLGEVTQLSELRQRFGAKPD